MARLITIKDIVELFLEENGYDGLCTHDPGHCSCTLEDLMPCDAVFGQDCVAARNEYDDDAVEMRPV